MNIWLSETIVRAVGWTLVHFVWEGLVIAAVLAVALRVMRRSPAHWRYLAGCAAMVAMAVAPLVTFQLVLGQDTPPPVAEVMPAVVQTAPVEPPLLADASAPASGTTLSIARTNTMALVGDDVRSLKYIRLFGHQLEIPSIVCRLIDRLQPQRLEAWLPLLVMAWVAGVCLLSCRLLAGWWQVRRLARKACGAAGETWERKLAELARRLGVQRSIRLLQSALVEVPTVVGWLRPVILLPASCLTGLSPGQLEAILAHELAHIRRHDYLINLLQSAVETLLFYHPAVWWVSRKVREERENCCDDLAVAVSGDRVGYARALATLEELRPASAQLALAASGAPLLRRIRRLAGQPERTAGRASWPVAGIVLLLGLGLVALGMRTHRAQAAEQGTTAGNSTRMMSASTNGEDTNSPPLESRTFKLNGPITRQGSNGVVLLGYRLLGPWGVPAAKFIFAGNGTNTNGAFGGGLPFITSVTPAVGQAGEHPPDDGFAVPGVDLNTNFGASLVWNERTDTVTVTATSQDLDAIGKALQVAREGGESDGGHPHEAGHFDERDTPRIATIGAMADAQFAALKKALQAPTPQSNAIEVTPGSSVSNAAVVATYVQDGRYLYEAAHYDEAEVKFVQVLAQDHKNVPAAHYLELIQEKKDLLNGFTNKIDAARAIKQVTEEWDVAQRVRDLTNNGAPNPYSRRSNVVNTSPGRKLIFDQLGRTRIESLDYRDLPLKDVLDDLSAKAKARDPDGKGINFYFSHEVSAPFNNPTVDANGNLVGAPDPNQPDASSATVHVSLQNVTMTQALDAILKTASPPVKYSVLDYGIMFSLRGNEPVPLEIRSFKVDRDTFLTNVLGMTGASGVDALSEDQSASVERITISGNGISQSGGFGGGPNGTTNYGGIPFVPAVTRASRVEEQVRAYFGAAGIDLSTNNGKAVIWNDRKGMLTIRATAADLDLIEKALLTTPAFGIAPVAPRNPTTSNVNSNLQIISARLDQIRVDANYPGMPLRDVLDDLHQRTQAADPARQGINFVFSGVDPNSASTDGSPVTVRLALRDVPVSQVLAAITSGSSRPVRYSVMDYGVIFGLVDTNQPPTLQIRSFLVTNSSFAAALRGATGTDLSSGRAPVQAAVRKYFAAKGIELSTNAGRAVLYNDRTGILTIRARAGELDAIEREIRKSNEGPAGVPSAAAPASAGPAVATVPILTDQQFATVVQALRATTPQTNGATNGLPWVKIKLKFVEITQNDTKAMGFQWQLGGISAGPVSGTNPAATNAHPLGFFSGTTNSSSGTPGAPVVVSTEIAPPVQAVASNPAAIRNQNGPRIATITGILTAPQNNVVLQALQQRDGTQIYDAPEQTIQSGHEAQFQSPEMQAGYIRTIPTNVVPPTNTPMRPGPSVSLTAIVGPDMKSVELVVTNKLAEFVGYDQPGQFVPQASVPTGGTITAVLPLPHFRLRESVTRVTVRDGETVALGGLLSDGIISVKDKVPLLGDLPLIGRFFRSESTVPVKKNLMIFVTVTLVNPDGTRFHSPDELPYRLPTTPPSATARGTNE